MATKNIKKFMGRGDILRAIQKEGKRIAAELTDQEVFMSPEFKNYATKIADFILRKHKRYRLDLTYNVSPDAFIAYTDGQNIVLNTGNSLASKPKLLEGRFKVNMGILFHEVAHRLFLDFDTHNRGLKTLLAGQLFGDFDVPAGSDLETNKADLEQKMADGYQKSVTYVYKEVLNIINDGHDEAVMKRCFPGFIAGSIEAAGQVQMEAAPTLSELVNKGAKNLRVCFSLMLQYAKYGYCLVGEESNATEPFTQLLSRMEPVIDDCLAEEDYKKRWTHINTLVLMLWPYVQELFDGSDNSGSSSNSNGTGNSGSSGGSNSSSDAGNSSGNAPDNMPSDEEVEQAIRDMAAAAQEDNAASQAPTGTGKAVAASAVASGTDTGSASDDGGFAAMLNQISSEKAVESVQHQMDEEQLNALRNTNVPLVHRDVPVEIERHHEPNKNWYDNAYAEVAPYVRNLITEMLALLREYNEEEVQHHRRFGPIIEATEAYRPDNTFFAKKKQPGDRPNMAMCILLDESGSMSGEKINTAKKAMVLLERFASGVGVPLLVAGHSAMGAGVLLNIYTDFVSAQPEKDRYSLGAIRSHGCNRDGLPLRLCAEMLAQRPEEIKLMVVISDGTPNDSGYSGKEAFDDIRKTVAEFRRKGLLIYGAAIDDDREVIQSLYGNGFLSITDLKSLPKTMVRLLRQNLV